MSTLLDRIKQQAQQKAVDAHINLPIAGYKDPEIFARYRFLPSDETKEIGVRIRAKYETDEDKLLHAGIAVMAEACTGLFVRVDGDLVELDLEDDGGIVTYEPRLATAFGFDGTTADETVRALFKGNDYAVLEHATLLQKWMSDTTQKVVGAVGEA